MGLGNCVSGVHTGVWYVAGERWGDWQVLNMQCSLAFPAGVDADFFTPF
jgi:hypothetical protein